MTPPLPDGRKPLFAQVPRRAIALGLVAGITYGIAARFAADSGRFSGVFATMTLSFLVLVPVVIGYLTVRPHPHPSWRYRILAPWVPMTLATVASWVAGWEGAICVVMALPILLLGSSIGGLLGGAIALRRSKGTAITMVLPLMTAAVEQRMTNPIVIHRVHTSIPIEAAATDVWAEIVEVPRIRPEEHRPALFTRLGFPRPVEATLHGRGVGARRFARFERGVLFLETVTDWVPERRLGFTVAAQTDSIPPSTLDRHVTIGGPYFDVLSGRYEIIPRPDGMVALDLTSELRVSTHFNLYATPWADVVMRSIQENILLVIRERAERRSLPGGRQALGSVAFFVSRD